MKRNVLTDTIFSWTKCIVWIAFLTFVVGCRKEIVEKYPNGKIKETKQVKYSIGKRVLDGVNRLYYLNGTIMVEQSYVDGKIQGVWKSYYPDGKRNTIRLMRDSLKNGYDSMWYRNGQLKYSASYKAGKLDGPYHEWDTTGRMLVSAQYVNGLEDGTRFVWFKSGERSEETFSNGEKNGKSTVWFSNGKKQLQGFFYKGKPCGVILLYDSTGILKEKKLQPIPCDSLQ